MDAVILAGGLGSRLRPFTEIIPKPLLPLGSQTLLEIQINQLKSNGFDNIYLATNYRSELIEAYLGDGSKYGVNIFYSVEKMRLGTCGPLSLLKDYLKKDFILMNGDILTKLDLGDFLKRNSSPGIIMTAATKVITTPFRFGNIETDDSGRIVSLEEKPTLSFEILAGIYAMNKSVLDFIPNNTYMGIDHLILKMLKEGHPVHREKINDYWIDIGQVEDYEQARNAYQSFNKEKS